MCRASEAAERQSATLMRHAEVDEDDDARVGSDDAADDGDNARAPKFRKSESCTFEELKQTRLRIERSTSTMNTADKTKQANNHADMAELILSKAMTNSAIIITAAQSHVGVSAHTSVSSTNTHAFVFRAPISRRRAAHATGSTYSASKHAIAAECWLPQLVLLAVVEVL